MKMTCAEFRNALAKLRFIELPASINPADYSWDVKGLWPMDAVSTFMDLSTADQEKVWAELRLEG
jgi:hypothetical protein